MPFTVHDLRYHAEKSYPALYRYLLKRAKSSLGSLSHDANEVDLLVEHVIEYLARLGLIGGADRTPLTALDRLSNAQFYAFLNSSIRNKAIDRLRKRRRSNSSTSELETAKALDEAVELIPNNTTSLPTSEEDDLESQEELSDLLKNSIKALSSAPHQLQAVLQELEEFGATELLKDILEDFEGDFPTTKVPLPNYSQHKDHAHKRLRQFLQKGSANLTGIIALRLLGQKARLIKAKKVLVTIQELAQEDLSKRDVRTALRQLTSEGFLTWNGEEAFSITEPQIKQLEEGFFLEKKPKTEVISQENKPQDPDGQSSTSHTTNFLGSVQGLVLGEHNTVTNIFHSSKEHNVPFLAPPQSPRLVGRDNMLLNLKQQLLGGKSVVLSALHGLPGVGKTALALALAHDDEVQACFHDGVLWAGLGRDADILLQLGTWAAALGLSQSEIGNLTDLKTLQQIIHATIGMRRMLLVIDDVWWIETALDCKIGGPNCSYLFTTRLPEVAVRLGNEAPTVVHELSEFDGLILLKQIAPKAVEVAPDKARELVQAVGALPLAIILIGNYLRVQTNNEQPHRLQRALDRLHHIEERLKLEQPQAGLENHPSLPRGKPLSLLATIEVSEEGLDEISRQTLRALSVFPPKPNTFSLEAALTVSAVSIDTLDILADAGLLESSGVGRYTLHQIISDYARQTMVDVTVYERMIEFFVQYIDMHKTDMSSLRWETTNILTAMQIAFDRRMQLALINGADAFSYILQILRGQKSI